ncbi:glycosyltransferase family 2 protein [Paenibacillus rhizophilus]
MKRRVKRSRPSRRSSVRRVSRSHKALYTGNHPEPLVSVIIPAMNEAGTIAAAIAEARKVHSRCEVIVVVNGSSDGTAEIAASCGGRVISYVEPLGHDVGRSVGAESAKGDILLFTDGDLVIPASQLRPFMAAVKGGADIALNDYSGPVHRSRPHPVVLSKHALNILLRRPDLKGCSMTAVPHALSRRALDTLGSGILSSPPVAQAKAILEGLKIEAAHKVPVGRMNVIRPKADGTDPLQQIIVADHLRAISLVLESGGERAGFSDGTRRREMVR